MQINHIHRNNENLSRPVFGAKLGSELKKIVKDDPRYKDFIKKFETWGDSNSVVDVYKTSVNGESKYMLCLSNRVLDNTNIPINSFKSEISTNKIIESFFNLSSQIIKRTEYLLFKNVKDTAIKGGDRYLTRLSNIIRSHKLQGIMFDPKTAKIFDEI